MNAIHSFDQQRVLVIGGAGFVGSNLVKNLLWKDPAVQITIVDNLLSSERSNVPLDSRVHFMEGSITDEAILNKLQDHYSYIFHLATYHGNQSSICDPLADHENNTLTTLKLYERIKNFKNLKKVVYSGAGCAVAEKTFEEAHASKETDIISLDADSPYSISKLVGEFYSKYYYKQHGLPIVRVRFQNVYGPGEILGAGRWRGTPATIWRNVVPTFIYQALNHQPLPLENDGIATRDFIFVEDIVKGLICAADKGKPGEVYNLATGSESSIRKLAEIVNLLTNNPAGLRSLPKRSWDTSGKRFGCPLKSKEELKFESKTSFERGLNITIEWTRAHMELIDETIAKHQKYIRLLA